jgi:hypothetical protein
MVCPYTTLKQQLMEDNNFHEHTNHMVFKWYVVLFCVFYVYRFAFKVEKEGGRFISANLGCELASSSRLFFILHEAFVEGDSNWRLGFQKDEESHIYEGGRFYKEGASFWV